MDNIFIAVASGGSYDDSWQRNEYFSFSVQKAQAYCDKMNALREVVIKARRDINAAIVKWNESHPRPDIKEPDLPEVPKWPSNVKPTKEMRAERERLQKINLELRNEAFKPYRDWADVFNDFLERLKAEYPLDVQEGIKHFYDVAYWEVEELKELP